ncbi:MAG: glycosyltransferase 87 family protein [Acetobacteraceae bacterium]|nr:glycosyltransferase 87 family protein [Acetobacteraceae bacterium]
MLIALAALVGMAVAAPAFLLPAQAYGDLSTELAWQYVSWMLAAGLAYAGLVWIVRRRRVTRRALIVALLIAGAARLVVVTAVPVMSTDLYRYVWDGRVQAAGINPYRYIPADPALERLRDAGVGPTAIYRNINRAESAPTIYPPAAQLLFAAIGLTASSIWTIKAVMLAFDVVTGLLAWRLLVAAGRPAAWVLVWMLNPLVIREFAGTGHIDAAAVAASVAALLLAARRRPGWAGAALGVAVLCKLLPAALGPAIWRVRQAAWGGWRTPLACLTVIAAGYALYASAGWRVLGYLPGYAQEEELTKGGGFLLLRLLALAGPLPGWAGKVYVVLGLGFLGGLALAIVMARDAPRPATIARHASVLSVALLVVLTPHYPWYLTMAILPAVVAPGWGALWPSLAGPLLYQDFGLSDPWWPAVVYLPAMAWLAIDLRRRTEDA